MAFLKINLLILQINLQPMWEIKPGQCYIFGTRPNYANMASYVSRRDHQLQVFVRCNKCRKKGFMLLLPNRFKYGAGYEYLLKRAGTNGQFGIVFRFVAILIKKLSNFPKKTHFGLWNPENPLLPQQTSSGYYQILVWFFALPS